jgi:MFS family permease
MTALVLGATISTRWFAARRGLVVGILTASVATGQLVFLPLLASLTERFGWRLALGFVCIMLGVSAFAVLLVMRDRPSDLGLRPFGDEGTESLPAPPASHGSITAVALGTLRDASKSHVFWILFATFFICGASTNGLVQVHLIPMCLDFGIRRPRAYWRRWASSISSAPSCRAGCQTATTIVICCSGITACVGSR